jgi:hypothetical protein
MARKRVGTAAQKKRPLRRREKTRHAVPTPVCQPRRRTSYLGESELAPVRVEEPHRKLAAHPEARRLFAAKVFPLVVHLRTRRVARRRVVCGVCGRDSCVSGAALGYRAHSVIESKQTNRSVPRTSGVASVISRCVFFRSAVFSRSVKTARAMGRDQGQSTC